MDGLGNPVEFMLSAGNDHDSAHAVELLKKVEISNSSIISVVIVEQARLVNKLPKRTILSRISMIFFKNFFKSSDDI